ncbi:MAG: hypothetical protein L0312_13695 [Acidobacteria bacterium]|nr:hypothetical protein [Acidobacteriota bacterium]
MLCVFSPLAEIDLDVRSPPKSLPEDWEELAELRREMAELREFQALAKSLIKNSTRPYISPSRQLELHIDHIRQGRTADDLLYEILLKSGFPLTTPVETLTLSGKTVHSVAEGALLICLEWALTLELIRAIAERKPDRVVCLDEGFTGNDQLKANAVQIFKAKGITSFRTV